MQSRRCTACGHAFRTRPQVPQQGYCPTPDCQRQRRRSWQKAKRESDPDYRDNQASAQRAWVERNPDYWREYRRTHPNYSERNRLLQLERNHRQAELRIAKMDASTPELPLTSGIYRISQVRLCQNCKDGRVDGENHFAISPVRPIERALQREDVIGGAG
jgi:hypothetical protein